MTPLVEVFKFCLDNIAKLLDMLISKGSYFGAAVVFLPVLHRIVRVIRSIIKK